MWNWEHEDWPNFAYDSTALEQQEARFLLHSGELLGAFRHVDRQEQDNLRIELISDEAVNTAAIEGEILDRASLQASLRGQFGLETEARRIPPQERGMAELMTALYTTFAEPLSDQMLFHWHEMVMAGTRGIDVIGAYRRHDDAMQIVSDVYGEPRVHFEAPPSTRVADDMKAFITWCNATAPDGETPLPPLTRSGLAHLYFESIHPFEDGNGRIGRALSEKALAQGLGQPTLIALARIIEQGRKRYCDALEAASRTMEVTGWLKYFAETVLTAQQESLRLVSFTIAKARLYERFGDRFNQRQAKVIARMFREGPDGFKGGLSAQNYLSITKTSRPTATRDLAELVALGTFTRTGKRRYTRYHLNLNQGVKA